MTIILMYGSTIHAISIRFDGVWLHFTNSKHIDDRCLIEEVKEIVTDDMA